MLDEDQQTRLEALEARVALLEAELAQRSRPVSHLPPPPKPGATPTPPARPLIPAEVRAASSSSEFDAEAALKWGGVGLVVLALGFAVSTAVRRGWLGPVAQLVGALVLSGALIAIGLRLRSTRRPWTHTLVSGGVTGLLVTFASPLFLDRVEAEVAYLSTVAAAALGLALARVVPSEWVAAVALAGGSVAWLVIGDGEPPFVASGAALAAAFVFFVALALERGWVGIRVLAQMIGLVCVLAMALEAGSDGERMMTVAVAAVVATALFTLPSVGGPIGEHSSVWRHVDVVVPTLLAPWAFGVVAALFTDTRTAAGLVALACAAVVAAVALIGRRRLVPAHFVAVLVGASVSLTVGLGLALSTEVAWVAIAVQGAGLVVVGRRLQNSVFVLGNAAVLTTAAAFYALTDGADAWTVDTDLGADLARLGVIAAVGAAVWVSGRLETRQVGGLVVLGLVMIWLGSVLVHVPQGQAAVSLSWAVIGVALMIAGAVRKMHQVATVGLVVLAITVGKLLYVDMREVDALWRAGLFLVVGVALMRLGYLLPRWTEAAPDESEQPLSSGSMPASASSSA